MPEFSFEAAIFDLDGVITKTAKVHSLARKRMFDNNLQVDYKKAIIVEDAVSGVQAGDKGNFGLVLGIAREGNEKELMQNGADRVIRDFSEITICNLQKWFIEKSGNSLRNK